MVGWHNIWGGVVMFNETRHQNRSLKYFFIFATCVAILAFVLPHVVLALGLAMGLKVLLERIIPTLMSLVTGPLWNAVDGALPFEEKKALLSCSAVEEVFVPEHEKPKWFFKHWHALFDWTLLLLPALACMAWAVTHMVMTMQWALPTSFTFNVLFGPYGALAFSLTMFFYAYESYQAMCSSQDEADKCIQAGSDGGPDDRLVGIGIGSDRYTQEAKRHQIDMVAWLFAGTGSLLLLVPSLAFVVHLAAPVILTFTITALLCYAVSSVMKCYQLRQRDDAIEQHRADLGEVKLYSSSPEPVAPGCMRRLWRKIWARPQADDSVPVQTRDFDPGFF